ncbi:hypothetical protein Tco_1334395 [Tanacetum coccineum]
MDCSWDRLSRLGIRIKRSCGVAVASSCIFWGCSKTFFNDDGSSYKLYMLVPFDLINHQFYVLDIPTQLKNSLPIPFYISKLGNTLVISGNLIHYEDRYICAWLLEVEAAVVTSWRMLFVIPSQNIEKLLGFTMDDDPIVEVDSGQEMVHTLQVYDRSSQQFHNGIEGHGGSFFIGPYKESLILLNLLRVVVEREMLFYENRINPKPMANYTMRVQNPSSPGGSSTPSFSPGTSSTLISSPTSSTPPIHYGGSPSNTECSNCKHLLGRIKETDIQEKNKNKAKTEHENEKSAKVKSKSKSKQSQIQLQGLKLSSYQA